MSSRVFTHTVKKIRILLFSEDPLDSRWLKQLLGPVRGTRNKPGGFSISRADRISSVIQALSKHHFEAVIIDLGLSTIDDLDCVTRITATAPHLPVIVLTCINNDNLALKAISLGAQECLFKESLDSRILSRSVHQALERKKNESKLTGRNRELEATRAQLEQQTTELRQCMEQLDQINHELEDFTYIASHDLKEPLRGISSYCEILLEDYRHKMDSDGKRRLSTILNLCDRLENLIDDLLTYCRVGRKAQIKTRLNLNTTISNTLKMLRPLVERRNAVVQISRPLPPLFGNAALVGMVFSNLIVNGLKFNQNLKPQVDIGYLATDPVTFYVKDNGIGIEKHHHDAIFTIFRRLHSRKKFEGSGAGLTIVKKIVQLHGGRIWLESTLGQGTTFYFTLGPATQSDHNECDLQPPHWVQRDGVQKLDTHSIRK